MFIVYRIILVIILISDIAKNNCSTKLNAKKQDIYTYGSVIDTTILHNMAYT